jgi:hypothetical protein
VTDHYAPHVVRADFAAVKRSILRYLERYERDWKQAVVWMPAWHFSGCQPPEEGRAVLTWGRVRVALGALVREGVLRRMETRAGCRYALTDDGRSGAQRG